MPFSTRALAARLKGRVKLSHATLANYERGVRPFHETERDDFLQAVDVSCYSLVALCRALAATFDTHDDKHALHFQPEIQAAFRKFCREYLTHTNPYRGLRRVDDPGIAMIEMCNENSFARAGSSLLRSAPEPYRTAIKQRWNQWLTKRYPNQTAEQAWGLKDDGESRSLTAP